MRIEGRLAFDPHSKPYSSHWPLCEPHDYQQKTTWDVVASASSATVTVHQANFRPSPASGVHARSEACHVARIGSSPCPKQASHPQYLVHQNVGGDESTSQPSPPTPRLVWSSSAGRALPVFRSRIAGWFYRRQKALPWRLVGKEVTCLMPTYLGASVALSS